ncbi:YjhT family mutarotase [Vibrio sp. F74]|uniref:YjhT family mutarotase n=1 Tax=Vibrio sp. F74 TaxID=700020 RepID=UPI0035F536A3
MSVVLKNLPDLPEGVKNGVATRDGKTLYAGLGSAGTRFFCLNLDDLSTGWQRANDFPGVERNDAVYITDKKGVWVFSGAGTPEGSQHAQVLIDVHRFDFLDRKWHKVATETPVGLLGGSGCEISKGQFVFFGGYNKQTFDNFCQKMANIDTDKNPQERQNLLTEFMSQEPEKYGWNKDILRYDTHQNRWELIQENPFAANCGAALISEGNKVTLIDGEIKPGLRSTKVKQFTFDETCRFESSVLTSIHSDKEEHEGLAGAYSGELNGHYFALGGAYFVGSQNNLRNGQWYTHQGLTKHYSDAVWRLDGKSWKVVARLPEGAAYGASVSCEKELILVGGENSAQQALVRCYLIR